MFKRIYRLIYGIPVNYIPLPLLKYESRQFCNYTNELVCVHSHIVNITKCFRPNQYVLIKNRSTNHGADLWLSSYMDCVSGKYEILIATLVYAFPILRIRKQYYQQFCVKNVPHH